MFAYVDETGNTGANVFDEDQPNFYTAAFLSNVHIDQARKKEIRALLHKHKIDSIHANRLGVEKVDSLINDVVKIIKGVRPAFFMSRVEKKYLIATKIFDTFFDSGENPAVEWHSYNIHPLRLLLCLRVAKITSEEVQRMFWEMLLARNEQVARALVVPVVEGILEKVGELPDQRTREIVYRALDWSRKHPDGLDLYINRRQARNGHMPNMVAFTNLLQGIDTVERKRRKKVERIFHDRQSQFEKNISEWHTLSTGAKEGEISWGGLNYRLRLVDESSLEFVKSDDSFGIQVADTFLWSWKRRLGGENVSWGMHHLTSSFTAQTYYSDFSFMGVEAALESTLREAYEAPLSDDVLRRAQKSIAEMRERSELNVSEYEKDGLMPYEREMKDGGPRE